MERMIGIRRLYGAYSLFSLTAVLLLGMGNPAFVIAQSQPVSPDSRTTTTLPERDSSVKCLECHQYWTNHHPVFIAPQKKDNYPFPLVDGKLTCLTCHTDDHVTGGEKLLRNGPYGDRREFCVKCHAAGSYEGIDPHAMLDSRGTVLQINGQPVCLVCHSTKPDPATDRTNDVRFRADVAFLCWRCHPPMANPLFFKEHFLVKPSLSMVKYLNEQQKQLQVTIPLVPRDRITCSTCHNPHQKGVILYAPSAKGADAPTRLRLPQEQLCIVCHSISK
ncbi:MAG TPA: hypothetical protein VK654_13285 [Nitrospirota bacterium]|nr:hypothetical protein [Nitrospirota bacterium]